MVQRDAEQMKRKPLDQNRRGIVSGVEFLGVAVALATALSVGCGGSGGRKTTVTPPDTFTTTTSQEGTLLVMTNTTSTDTVRIGLQTLWGGSIVEVSLNGTNFVSAPNTGQEVQPAFYDGNAHYDNCAGCTGNWGWDPVLAGDGYNHGTPTISQALTATSLYTKAQPLQWIPDGKGGGPSMPVPSDVLVEQTIMPVAGHSHAFQVHTKLTHLGSDFHADAEQEFPAVYVDSQYDRFMYYGGTAPWTNAPVSATQFPLLGDSPGPFLYVPEHWGAHVNTQNAGLTLYAPSQYPFETGFDSPGDGTNYFRPFSMLSIGANFTFDGDYYVIAGDYTSARQIIYDLHQKLGPPPNIFAALGSTDVPQPGTTLSASTTVSGWAYASNAQVSSVQILVDKIVDGTASYGSPRDVTAVFPHAPLNIEFSYSLDTTKYGNGPHVLNVQVTDATGIVSVFSDVPVTISN